MLIAETYSFTYTIDLASIISIFVGMIAGVLTLRILSSVHSKYSNKDIEIEIEFIPYNPEDKEIIEGSSPRYIQKMKQNKLYGISDTTPGQLHAIKSNPESIKLYYVPKDLRKE